MAKSVEQLLVDLGNKTDATNTKLDTLIASGVKVDTSALAAQLTGIQNGINLLRQDIEIPPVVIPALVSLSQTSGSINGGETVTANGTGFEGVTGVLVGTVAAMDVVVANDTTLTYTSPAQGSGPEDVTIVGPGGTSPVVPAGVYIYS